MQPGPFGRAGRRAAGGAPRACLITDSDRRYFPLPGLYAIGSVSAAGRLLASQRPILPGLTSQTENPLQGRLAANAAS